MIAKICDAIKQNESEVEKYDFWHFLLGYYLGFNLVKPLQRLVNWFQRYKQLKDSTNNKKQKKLSSLFGCILKTLFASSDLFCLITSHIRLKKKFFVSKLARIFQTDAACGFLFFILFLFTSIGLCLHAHPKPKMTEKFQLPYFQKSNRILHVF